MTYCRPLPKEVLSATGFHLPFKRPSLGILARSVEILYALDEAISLIDQYEPPDEPTVPIAPCAGIGVAATEAPRGLLYHRYQVNSEGTIEIAKIVPPTSQNQRRIEDDLRNYLPSVLHLSNHEAALGCERLIRSYDPCISCATHFLRLHIQRA